MKHNRAASEIQISGTVTADSVSVSLRRATIEGSPTNPSKTRHASRKGSDEASNRGYSPVSKLYEDGSDEDHASTIHSINGHGTQPRPIESNMTIGPYHSNTSDAAATTANTLSGIGEDPDETVADANPVDSLRPSPKESEEGNSQELGATFDDLVDRLLAQPMSKSDTKFAVIFLCLYRKFAAPFTLISAIVRRFEDLNDTEIPYLSRMTSQLRYLNILKDWISDYPGDFAHPTTRRIMAGFVQTLAGSQEYAVASKEISPHLDVVLEDDDTEWACSDKSRSRTNTMESFLTMSSIPSMASTVNAESPTLTADSSTEDIIDHASPEKPASSQSTRISATPSSASSMSRTDSHSTGSFQTLLNTVENAQRQAQGLAPSPRVPLTKIQWHQFMELPDEKVARELTRIDWMMYSAIRPRDLIRHVSLSAEQKEKCNSLEHVNRMIQHFNHVAFWVANMILLREKPKHRAKALEKFMGVAWKLRQLNNYNSLGAVIAGINGTAVHRLAQTRELIPPQSQKEFMRLEILMGTQKSHFAYRLAYANTSTARIPFLPLHRRDLVLAEQGNKTYVSLGEKKRINWKKFEIMGEVIISIRQSQQVPYPYISRNDEVRQLVLDGRFCKDDDVSSLNSTVCFSASAGVDALLRFVIVSSLVAPIVRGVSILIGPRTDRSLATLRA